MPTMRITYTRISSDVAWQWDESSVRNAIDVEETFCKNNYSMTVDPVVTVSDLEQYQDYNFPTTTDFNEYLSHYDDPSFSAPVPAKAGVTLTVSFPG